MSSFYDVFFSTNMSKYSFDKNIWFSEILKFGVKGNKSNRTTLYIVAKDIISQ